MKKIFPLSLFCFLFTLFAHSNEAESLLDMPLKISLDEKTSDLVRDLEALNYWEQKEKALPATHNHLLHSGYFNMPSSRMKETGYVGFGYSYVPPYKNYNIHFQPFKILEISGNYRIFEGISDVNLSSYGFGDYADKGVNLKFSIISPEDSDYKLPGISIGLEDFLGSKLFSSKYIVSTKVWKDYNLETSIGFGSQRMHGIFAGFAWMPYYKNPNAYLKNLTISAEYDATDYKHKEPHPEGRKRNFPINYGLKYCFADYWNFSLSHIRGKAIAAAMNVNYNLGKTEGFLPKIEDPENYRSPINTQKLDAWRSKDNMTQEFVFAFKNRGFNIRDIALSLDENGKNILWISLENEKYRKECKMFEHIASILQSLTPSNISQVTVTVEAEGFPIHRYDFQRAILQRSLEKKISLYEMEILSPKKEVAYPQGDSLELYRKNKSWGKLNIKPRMRTFFGSASGKLKATLGAAAEWEGFLFDELLYRFQLSYTFLSNMEKVKDVDRLNPSQIINVQSDYVRYHQSNTFSIEEAYLQKNWNLGEGWFSRISGGHFEAAYGGLAGEFLYFPVNNNWAIGTEAAVFKKRKYNGLKFKKQIRKLTGFRPSYQDFTGRQYFLNLYYDIPSIDVELKASIGQFLALDKGIRTEISRYFSNGMKISLWYTRTNAQDQINNERYFDKGIAFSMPLDIFYKHSNREIWGYGMSAWLRDVGFKSSTGKILYDTIQSERKKR